MFGKNKPKQESTTLSVEELIRMVKALPSEQLQEFTQKLDGGGAAGGAATEGEDIAKETDAIAEEPLAVAELDEPAAKPQPADVVQEPKPQAEQATPDEPTVEETVSNSSSDEGEFFNGENEDNPVIEKLDESSDYDPDADKVEMYQGGESDNQQEEPVNISPQSQDTEATEQGDIIAALQAKIVALETENTQMKAKFGGNFGYGNAPSFEKGRYQSKDEFIKTLPQIRKI